MSKPDREQNVAFIVEQVLDGKLFPIQLYGYKVTCNCENAYMMIYGSPHEQVVKDFDVCPICKSKMIVSDDLVPSENATMIILSDGGMFPAMVLSSLTPEDVKKLDDASKKLWHRSLRMRIIIKKKVEEYNKLGKKGDANG
jgi:hypothetical protein